MATASSEDNNINEQNRRDSKEEEFLVEPLDLMRINVPSKDKLVPALNIGFMEPKLYISYVPLPSLITPCITKCSAGDEEEWIERMICLEDDFSWLLKLPHYRFWSQVVYDEELQKCLQTYLSHAPRCYEMNFSVRKELLEHQNKVHKLVFSIFLRMSTYKETKLHHITPAVFGNLIYNHFLFDIPRMMDLCILYGFKNQAIISKMISNLFSTQPKYMEDLDEACSTTLLAFDSVEQQLQNLNLSCDEVLSLTNGTSMCSPISSTSLLELLDIVNYITDISATLYIFLECYPAACTLFLKYGTATRIPHFYDSILTDIQNDIETRESDDDDYGILNVASKNVALSKTFFIKTFRNILCSCIQCVLNAKYTNLDDCVHMAHFESYLQVVNEIIVGTVFKYDYNLQFPIEDDLLLFANSGIAINPSKINHILESIGSTEVKNIFHTSSSHSKTTTESSPASLPGNKSITNLQDLAASLSATNTETKMPTEGATPAKPDESTILSLISNIRDILSLGDGFIECCLEYYNYDSEKVIDSLLSDESLPQHLSDLDRQMKRIPKTENTRSVLDERKNIFDYDEFDVFHRDSIPMDKVRFGKNNKTQKVSDLLSDTKDFALLKELTLKYGDNEANYKEDANMYEDEYDDTYDSVEFSIPEPEAELELLAVRPFTVPRVLASFKKDALDREKLSRRNKTDDYEEGEEEDDENETNDTSNVPKPLKHRDEFCENPEIQRQRYQQRQEAREQNKPRSYQNSHRSSEGGNQSQNFRNKEKHKSNMANHNRRKQSDFKRSRGMLN